MGNTNFQTIHQMGTAISNMVKQATGRDDVQNIDMEHITVAQNHRYEEVDVSGQVVSFHAEEAGIPLEKMVVQIMPVQSGSGDPSPENIRPITGWTEANVTRTGVNVWDEEWESGNIDTVTGENRNNVNTIRSKNYIPVIPLTNYYMLLPWAQIFFYNANKEYIAFVGNGVAEDGAIHGKVITTLPNAYYMRFRNSGTYGTTYNHDISINYPATDTAYHPGHVQTIPITFPFEAGTVYGGTLDVTTGELVVDRANIASYNGETLPGEWISDRDVYAEGTTPTIGSQVVYQLSTPITYQLTPQEITILLGTNNIWADTGDIEVKFTIVKELY